MHRTDERQLQLVAIADMMEDNCADIVVAALCRAAVSLRGFTMCACCCRRVKFGQFGWVRPFLRLSRCGFKNKSEANENMNK